MGAGMGLSSAYGIARQSGGFLAVESGIGRGSIFRLHFPWIEPESGKDARLGREPGRPASILIAAETEILRRFLSRSLGAEGYAVAEAADGPRADSIGEAVPVLDLLIAEDPFAQVRASSLAARLKVRHPNLAALSIPAAAEVSDLPVPPQGASLRPLPLPLTRSELIAGTGRVLEGMPPEKTPQNQAPGVPPQSGSQGG
jgi:CheY-like chemotaxis protein